MAEPAEPAPSLPVLIVPGIICSALRVEESQICPEWVGQRVFAPSMGKVAASTLHRKGTWHQSEEGRLQNALLHHFVLRSPSEESPGIRVRAVEGGLTGLNLFDAGTEEQAQATGKRQGNLYAGVIKALRAVGYSEGAGLECAAYDWRMAPGVLEKRDDFFTRMKEQIERMNRESPDGQGVVLLGHSMGNKVVQYFLNFIVTAQGGQAWLDRNVYSWVVVGAPLLGAAYCGRMAVSGDCPYPGLDSIFSKHELVILFRSLSSLPWLFPIGAHSTHLFYVRREGVLEISGVEALVSGYGFSAGNRLKLLIEVSWGRGYGSASVTTKTSTSFDGKVAVFDDASNFMVLGGPPELPHDATITVTVAEKGLEDGRSACLCAGGPCCLLMAPCSAARLLRLTCSRGARCSGQCLRATCSAVTGQEDIGTPRAWTKSMRLASALRGGGPVRFRLPLRQRVVNPWVKGEVVLHMRWLPAEKLRAEWSGSRERLSAAPQAGLQSCLAGLLPCLRNLFPPTTEVPVQHCRRPHTEVYDKVSLTHVLRMMRCDKILQAWEDLYRKDPLYNDAGTDDVPPVKRAIAISGCDVRTEVGTVLRVNSHRTSDKTNVRTRFVPDEEAAIVPGSEMARSCSLSAGVIFEEGWGDRQAGDGTVPFCSLHHSSTWADKLEYEEHFLSHSAHSLNMFDPRFHKLLIKALTLPSRGDL